ncbi:hypothetical protein CONCODRAFT_67822 [Conidiobolus coronatus NRRL 28638]|uniref:Galactose oxidase n=1 Tax=Conidiobolus coronatus (strain ATCC 28846 / CBS 209.66 / NRRL 28638) TaxID=796925 RepID=A0A137PGI6_CONC2|nr:hypothetical protein CONCODRAFT_67822 [Conidiobolus coronatus NRRL 28638]|eukprot:KXN74051.1 hypothetical protein CONCODRAFT_67822 [Conidiobolus coronatus NRRL 28638]
MYFTGGAIGPSVSPINDIYQLNLKVGFNITNTTNNLIPSTLPQDSRLPVFGAVFNPTLNGSLLYVYGGSQNNFTLANTGTAITGQADDNWTQLASSPDVPAMRFTTGVRINNTIVILPGAGSDDVVKDLKSVYLYDIPSDSWKVQSTTRSDRRQVVQYKPVVYKNQILIQGGVSSLNTTSSNFTAWDDLIALDVTNWQFTIHKLNTNFGSTIRIGYGAWTIGDQLVQFFGQPSPVQPTASGTTFNPMQVIDLNTFQAVPTYTPPPDSFFNASQGAPASSTAAGLSTGAIIGIVFGVLGLILIIAAIVYFFRRKITKLKEELSPPDYFGDRNSKHVSQNVANDNGLVWAGDADNRNKVGNNGRNTANDTDPDSSNITLTEMEGGHHNGRTGHHSSGNNRSYNQDQDQRIFNLNETRLGQDELDDRFDI